MPKIPRRYEKADAHTIKLIVEKEQQLDLAGLIEAETQLNVQIKDLIGRLENISEIIAEAKKMGITPKVKDKDVKKKPCPQCKEHMEKK